MSTYAVNMAKKSLKPLLRAEFRKSKVRMTSLNPLLRAEFRKSKVRMTSLTTPLKPLLRAEFRKSKAIYIKTLKI